MRKIIISIFCFILLFSLVSCGTNKAITHPNNLTTPPSTTIPSTDDNTDSTKDDELDNMKLTLKIDNQEVEVYWLDNDSVKTLKQLAKNGLTIELHQYGGFEQTGSLGTTITSNDTQMDVGPGDIVLYNSNQICLYYSNNSWSFTKLGHINLSKSELVELLSESDNVTISLTLK